MEVSKPRIYILAMSQSFVPNKTASLVTDEYSDPVYDSTMGQFGDLSQDGDSSFTNSFIQTGIESSSYADSEPLSNSSTRTPLPEATIIGYNRNPTNVQKTPEEFSRQSTRSFEDKPHKKEEKAKKSRNKERRRRQNEGYSPCSRYENKVSMKKRRLNECGFDDEVMHHLIPITETSPFKR